ncbi:hypothetical protein L1049_025346 [Liquidambar formosana]|uniref:EF-hand domain-containing protein n=1 Tax=Liquidambar formosana TaxID=63359 RepID=A0AAP0N7Y4_LIQFO
MANKPTPLNLLLLLLLLILCTTVHGRLITTTIPSDGVVHDNLRGPPTFLLRFSSSSESCEQTYGFMPCTTTVIGNLFLILVYGYLMFVAANCLSDGSELFLEILGPGIVGGLLLPVLGAFPDAMLILVSGLSGSTETAQDQVSIGMGLLAGSTITLLTIIWGSCIIVGKCDLRIQDSHAIDKQDTKGFNLTGSGIGTDIWTSFIARIMALSILPFIVVQILQVLPSTSGRHLSVLISLIFSLLLWISYCLYQVTHPWIQKTRIAYAKHKHVIAGFLRNLHMDDVSGRLLMDDGEPNREAIKKLFTRIDLDKDEKLSTAELRAVIIGIQFEEIGLDENDALEKVMKEFDTSNNDFVEVEEFVEGISKWLNEAKRSGAVRGAGTHAIKALSDFLLHTKREHDLLGDQILKDQSDEVVEGVENPRWACYKAVLMLVVGATITVVFADPLVDAVDNFSTATSIPSFFVSFIALPLATNTTEAVSAIYHVSQKRLKTASLTFSEIYGAVTMNNLLCLSVFSALVYFRELTWNFSAEVLVIVIVCIVMGAFASFRTSFPLWMSLMAFLLYPFSLALVYVLDYVLGWS